MADVFSPAKRSDIMSRIKGKNTTPEIHVRRLLHSLGYRFRLHVADLPGKPDIVFPRHRKVIFIHGCFWHGHKACSRGSAPSTRVEFWQHKIEGNRVRDRRIKIELRKMGWAVLEIWQCQLSRTGALTYRLLHFLHK